ncbi:SDR family oxidoreductase [Marinoscillum furvescens]|nr:SDR family oxidoreductase [Marinoscillum furvescens]
MKILIIGANGKIGQRLTKKLKNTSHPPRAMYRDEVQVAEAKAAGIDAVYGDLEKDFEHAFDGVEAVVFTAGSGAHTGQDKTHLVDRIGAKKAIDTAVKKHVMRFIMVSAYGADASPDQWPDSMKHYYEAKADADKHLLQTQLDFTILKPGRLTDDPGTNNIAIGDDLNREKGTIPRADVATVIEKCLSAPQTIRRSLELLSGDDPIDKALASL